MSEHTPTPLGSDNSVEDIERMLDHKSSREAIVRAVNAYDREQEIKKGLLTALYKLRHELKYNKRHLKFWDMADSAIAKAEAL